MSGVFVFSRIPSARRPRSSPRVFEVRPEGGSGRRGKAARRRSRRRRPTSSCPALGATVESKSRRAPISKERARPTPSGDGRARRHLEKWRTSAERRRAAYPRQNEGLGRLGKMRRRPRRSHSRPGRGRERCLVSCRSPFLVGSFHGRRPEAPSASFRRRWTWKRAVERWLRELARASTKCTCWEKVALVASLASLSRTSPHASCCARRGIASCAKGATSSWIAPATHAARIASA